MFYLRHNTADQYIPVLIVDDNGEPAIIVTPTIKIAKNNGAFGNANDGDWSAQSYGRHLVRVNATDSNTIGCIQLHVEKTNYMNFDDDGYVLPQNVYDAWFAGTDRLEVDVKEVESSADKAGYINTIHANLLRVLGLTNENKYTDNVVYTNGKMTSCRVRTFSTYPFDPSVDPVLATYVVTVTYSGNQMDSWKMERQ